MPAKKAAAKRAKAKVKDLAPKGQLVKGGNKVRVDQSAKNVIQSMRG